MERPKVPTAREIMTRSLVTLRPEMKAVAAAELLLQHSISGAPVVSESGELLGLLSEYDCLKAVASAEYELDRHDAIDTVADLMTSTCHTVAPGLDLFGLAHEFVKLRVRRFPVVEDGQLIGQVSRRDALRAAVELRHKMFRDQDRLTVYPQGREPIRDYPR